MTVEHRKDSNFGENKPSIADVVVTSIKGAAVFLREMIRHPLQPFDLVMNNAQRTVSVVRDDSLYEVNWDLAKKLGLVDEEDLKKLGIDLGTIKKEEMSS